MCSIPELSRRYVDNAPKILRTAPLDAENDFPVQFSKVACALLSDKYVVPQDVLQQPSDTIAKEACLEKYIVAPRMFKHLVGKGNREFSSGRQQDASEYFQHFLNFMQR